MNTSAKISAKFNENPRHMEPLLPLYTNDLQDIALEIFQKSAILGGRQHPVVVQSLENLLAIINSYYSNRIESHDTHPYDIERAMHEDYDTEPAKRDLQRESVAHIAVQRYIRQILQNDPALNVAGKQFLCDVHRQFFRILPISFQIVTDPVTGKETGIASGEFRTQAVKVGHHEPPHHESLPSFTERFAEFYEPSRHYGAMKLIAAAASHHRLMWIHPFLDGNGRVARLYTDAYCSRIPLAGYGLWSISRGLARRDAEYKAALSWADAPRRNELDGRGNLSNDGLVRFCRFFLEVCLDQVEYMGGILKLESLMDRIQKYVLARNARLLLVSGHEAGLRKEAEYMLREALICGEVSRGEVVRVSGLKERTGRELLGQLIQEGLLTSGTPKGAVKLGFPTHAAKWLLPGLFPER